MTAHPDSVRTDAVEATLLPTASVGLTTRTSIEPDEHGHFGVYGGRHVPEALMAVIDEVTTTFQKVRADDDFLAEVRRRLQGGAFSWTYREVDPDVFGEELLGGAYIKCDRIAAVVLEVTRPAS